MLDLNALADPKSSSTVRDVFLAKHPVAREVDTDAVITTPEEPPSVHPVMFEKITGKEIKSGAFCTQGAAGPSGIDAAS